MFLSLSSSMSCLRVSNAEDKSSSISCIGCPVSSELYKSSKRCVCVYVYVCMCVWVYVYGCMCMGVCVWVYVCMCMCVCVCVCNCNCNGLFKHLNI